MTTTNQKIKVPVLPAKFSGRGKASEQPFLFNYKNNRMKIALIFRPKKHRKKYNDMLILFMQNLNKKL